MIRVLVVDDLKLICRGLKAMFVSEPDIEIVGFAHNGKEAIKQIAQEKPDVILIDVLMPVMGGIEATKEISKQFPEVKVIVLSSFEDDPIILEAITAGARGYLLKNMMAEDLASAIRSVHRGSSHFAPGIIDSLAKSALPKVDSGKNSIVPRQVCTIDNKKDTDSPTLVPVKAKATPAKATPAKVTPAKTPKKAKPKPEKPLFQHGDWITVVLGVVVLSQTNGMGHHLAHAGLFFLMLALIARPIRFWWDVPLKHRRAIGIFAFAATLAHAIYATFHVMGGDIGMILAMSAKNQAGIWAGVISLAVMTPAAVTSFQFLQRKLGKRWRQIHLLTVPALALAVLHTVLIGPHYMAEFKMETLDYIRTYGIVVVGALVLLMRRRIFWSALGLNKLGKQSKKVDSKSAKSSSKADKAKELVKT
jgi:DNA-binding NarL/FixJ family response regulator/DMSO/TMAO reductase YedYZ heme-binding membrane subunit